MIGKTLGKYRITEQIGRGGMAQVYKAHHAGLDRYVAVKIMHNFLADQADFLERFQREARSVARLRHPNIVQMHDFDAEDNITYMVMEYLQGPSLKEHLAELQAQGKWLSLQESVRIVRDVGEALDYAHRRDMFHRDVKPANVMLTQDGGAILTDFGIVKMLSSDATQITATGAMVGTPAYMAPEQSMEGADDARVDVYSLGIVLYQLVTGRLPYEAETPMAVVFKHVNAPLPMPSVLNPGLPEGIERVILKALAKKPDDRYQSVREMLAHLDRAMRGLAVPEVDPAVTVVSRSAPDAATLIDTHPPAPAHAAKKAAAPPVHREPRRRGRWIFGLVGLTVVTAIIVIALILIGQGDRVPLFGDGATPAPTVMPPTATATATSTPAPNDTPPATATNTPDLTAASEQATIQAIVLAASAPPPTPEPSATAMPSDAPTATPTSTPTALPSVTPTPGTTAVVLQGGAELRPGANTWWNVRQTLPAGTEVELIGYDPGFDDWVHVRTADGATGWTQAENLSTQRKLDTLPEVTTIPTLTPAPLASSTPVSPPPSTATPCAGGALRLDAWSVGKSCTSSGWTANIFVEGHGGNCLYTYAWENQIQGGPMTSSMTFEVHSAGFGASIVGRASATSAGETVGVSLLIQPPSCP